MLGGDGNGKGFGKQAARYVLKRARNLYTVWPVPDIRSNIVNELVKKELLRLNVDYALFKEHRVTILYSIPSHCLHTFWLEPVPSDWPDSRSSEDEEPEQEFELVGETDAERREALLASDQDADPSDKLGPSSYWKSLEQEFDFNNYDQATSSNVPISDIDLFPNDDDDDGCNIPVASGSTFTHGHSSAAKGKGKSNSSKDIKENTTLKVRHRNSNAIGLDRMVEVEMDLRKKESLGMAPVKGSGRTWGSRSIGMTRKQDTWNCLVCTLSVPFCCSISSALY